MVIVIRLKKAPSRSLGILELELPHRQDIGE
ncbi:MAG: hypothetical protein QOJ64_3338 [Acidobacteriota bacterium]|nr:hypothetical protein [Acidobacteriota bacterium]